MPAQQNHTVWTAYLSSGTVAVGQVVCLTTAGTRYQISTADNRASASRKSAGIAISATDAEVDPAFELQFVGVVPNSITGLGDGSAALVKVSDDGALERVVSVSPSDEIVGRCDADGTAYLNFAQNSEIVGALATLGPTIVNDGTGQLDDVPTTDDDGNPADVILFTGSGTVLVTGFAGGGESRRIRLMTASSDTVVRIAGTSAAESTDSSAANRVRLSGSGGSTLEYLSFGGYEVRTIVYDDPGGTGDDDLSELRWHVEGMQPPAGTTGQVVILNADGSLGVTDPTSGAVPGSPTSSLQFNDAGALGGLDNWYAATGGADLGYGTGNPPSTGSLRIAKGAINDFAFQIVKRNVPDDGDVVLLQSFNDDYDLGGDVLILGGDGSTTQDTIATYMFSRQLYATKLTHADTIIGGEYQGWGLEQIGFAGSVGAVRVFKYTNLAIDGARGSSLAATDFGGGKSVMFWGQATTEPTTNPTTGVVLWNKPGDGEMYYRKTDGTERPMALVGEWSQVSSSRINATTTGYISYGTAGDTFPSTGFLRISDDVDGSPADIITWRPESLDLSLMRAYLRSGITELHLGGSEPDPTNVVDECYFHGERMFFRNAARVTWQLDSIVTNQQGITDFFLTDRVITNDATPTAIWTWATEAGSTTSVEATIVAAKTDNSAGASYKRIATFLNDGVGGSSQIGTTTAVSTNESDASWDATIDMSGGTVRIMVTGKSATDITWTANVWVKVVA